MDIPNIAVGARFWAYHLKPKDAPAYFLQATSGITLAEELWKDVVTDSAVLWFAPTQVLITFEAAITNPVVADRTLVLTVTGRDQFGYPADETVEFIGVADGATALRGTKRCYARIDSVTADTTTNIDSGDEYSFGIGTNPGPLGTGVFYRLPTPARVREDTEVLAVQEVFQNKFFLALANPSTLNVDVEHQSLEVGLANLESTDLRFATLLEPKTTSI
jgi:hypothetical protein